MTDFLSIITLIEYLIMLICHAFSIYYFGCIIYWSGFQKFHLGMNISMHLYIYISFAFSAACIIFTTYLTLLWRPDSNIYDAYWIFVTGCFVSILLITLPLISCFLGLDRCLCLLFPFKNTKLWNKIVFSATIISIAIFWALEIPLYILQAVPTKSETPCRSFGCLAPTGNQVYTTLRYITAIGSVVIGTAIIKLFNTKVTKQYSIKNTRLIVITLIAAILFDFLPSFISFCFSTFFNINLTKAIGPFSTTFSSINSLVCGYQYFTTLRQLLKSKRIGFIAPTSTNTARKMPNLKNKINVPTIVH